MNRPRVAVTGKIRTIGPWSRDVTLTKLDGRTREASLLRTVVADLTEYCDGKPNIAQQQLIEELSIIKLRVSQFKTRIVHGETLSVRETNYFIAWTNAYRRGLLALKRLGEAPPDKPLNLKDYFRNRSHRRNRIHYGINDVLAAYNGTDD